MLKKLHLSFQIFASFQQSPRSVVSLLVKLITEVSKIKLCEPNRMSINHFPKDKTDCERWRKSVPIANLNVTNNSYLSTTLAFPPSRLEL